MQEVIIENNTTGLRVFINGVPNLKSIPKDEAESTIVALELQISEFYEKKYKDKKPWEIQ